MMACPATLPIHGQRYVYDFASLLDIPLRKTHLLTNCSFHTKFCVPSVGSSTKSVITRTTLNPVTSSEPIPKVYRKRLSGVVVSRNDPMKALIPRLLREHNRTLPNTCSSSPDWGGLTDEWSQHSISTYKHLRAWFCTEPDLRVAGARCDPTMYPARRGAPNITTITCTSSGEWK
jgi:hypothetical protein